MTGSPLLIGVDASTTSVRSIVFDQAGDELASGRAPLSYQRVGADGYEQDAAEWYRALIRSLKEAISQLSPEDVARLSCLSIAHQRETVVITDAFGEPLGPALLWMDARCFEDVVAAERSVGRVRLHALSGKPPCTTPSFYKLMYLLRTNPSLRSVAHIHDVHSLLCLRLTGRSLSSLASADPSGLVDMRAGRWAESLLQLLGLQGRQMPELVQPGHLVGPLLPEVLEETGLPSHVLVYAGAGDGQASGLGAGAIKRGHGFIDIGAAVSAGITTSTYQIDQAFRTLHAAIPGQYSLETSLRGGMLTLFWLVETVLKEAPRGEALARLEAEAARITTGADGLVALPYWSGVMNPYWDETGRGALIGLHPGHGPAHMYRAILEGIALEQRLHLEGIESASGEPIKSLVVLGGGSRSDLWCQILADVLGRPLKRGRIRDAAALGVAMLSAVSHGIFQSFDHAVEAMARHEQTFTPGKAAEIYDRLYREVYRGLYKDITVRMAALSSIRQSLGVQAIPSLSPPSSDA